MSYRFDTLKVEIKDQLATVTILPIDISTGKGSPVHWELGELFAQIRGDHDVRVVVIQGSGDTFFLPKMSQDPSVYQNTLQSHNTDPAEAWRDFGGLIRFHEEVAGMPKPVVAKVNGDTMRFGSSIAFACDLIVAAEDAKFLDDHLGHVTLEGGPPARAWGVTPGDGGVPLMPLHLSPTMAKEYLLLGRIFTGAELHRLGAINYAVPRSELDSLVADIVQRLLYRTAYGLGWAKRLANKHIMQQLNLTLDAAAAHQLIDFYQHARSGGKKYETL